MSITVRKNTAGKPRYRVKGRDELGAYYPSKTYGTIRDAQDYERKLQDRRAKRDNAISALRRSVEVHNYLDEWSQSRRHSISRGWADKTASLSQIYILPIIGGVKLRDVRSPHIGRIMLEMKELGRSEQTRLHVFNILNRAF